MTKRYLDDFEAGQTFRSARIRIDADRIKTFAAEFDPQPFHLDERAATDSIFRGLAASGCSSQPASRQGEGHDAESEQPTRAGVCGQSARALPSHVFRRNT